MSDAAPRLRLATESIAGQRPYQEDAVLTETLPDGRTLVAVADGMGGHAAGEVASALALETLTEALRNGRDLKEAFILANQEVHEKAREPGKQGMGTTLVAMLLDQEDYIIANVGDSRGYVLSHEGARQVTQDHSFVAEAVKRGESAEKMLASQWKDALTRSIGTEPEVEADIFGPFPREPDTAVLLCSDGLYKTLSDSDLFALFLRSGGPRGATQTLVSTAFERGSDDNITVALVEFGEVPRDRPAGTMPLEWEPPDEDGTSQTDVPTGRGRSQDDAGAESAGGAKQKKRGWWPFGQSS
jgi:protein phosphatase